MGRILCSVPILTLNSKATLERTLPILAERFDDVFLVDGNSTDGTQEYARSLGVRVEKQFNTDEPNQRITDFRETRLKSWKQCRHDWLFVFDADEVPTPELLDLVGRIVEGNETSVVHRVKRFIQLPDGRVIRNTPFYIGHYVRLFALSSGVTLADRKVHERFLNPPGTIVMDHPEAILCPEPDPEAIRERCVRYIEKDAETPTPPTWAYLFRWIVWYNLRSLFGQFVRVLIAQAVNAVRGEDSLPWSYNAVFLGYRWKSMNARIRRWTDLHRKHAV